MFYLQIWWVWVGELEKSEGKVGSSAAELYKATSMLEWRETKLTQDAWTNQVHPYLLVPTLHKVIRKDPPHTIGTRQSWSHCMATTILSLECIICHLWHGEVHEHRGGKYGGALSKTSSPSLPKGTVDDPPTTSPLVMFRLTPPIGTMQGPTTYGRKEKGGDGEN